MTILVIDLDGDPGGVDGSAPLEGPYATVGKYLAKFGIDEAVQLLSDEESTLTRQLLLDAVAVTGGNGVWTGTPSGAEQAAALAALERLQRELEVQTNYMDGFLRAAVLLPLSADDANAGVLENCCLWLTRGGLADDADNSTERLTKACDLQRAWLRDISAKRVQLVGATGAAVVPAGTIKTGQAVSRFDWASFGGGFGGCDE